MCHGDLRDSLVVDEVRRKVALRMVAESSLPLVDVAFVTGFSEISAFYRAFRRWTSATPAEWRRTERARTLQPISQ
jgi:transcriptional regulator GlxA family with amidase domain